MSTYYSTVVFTLFCLFCSAVLTISDSQPFSGFVSNFDDNTAIDKALDALNEIQVSGDGGMMLYLTFPNIYHRECKGTVNTFEISREEFRNALIDVMSKNNRTLNEEERSKLATTASLPLEWYTIKACGSTTEVSIFKKGEVPPQKGTWIITEIFGVSDLLINW